MVLGRKGDVTITTVILIVLGLAVLVMMIIGFTRGWDTIFGPLDNAPSELQTLAEACKLYAQGGLSIDFCNFRVIEIDGEDEIVNCRDERIVNALLADNVNLGSSSSPLACTMSASNRFNLDAICASVGSARDEIKVNGEDNGCLAETST